MVLVNFIALHPAMRQCLYTISEFFAGNLQNTYFLLLPVLELMKIAYQPPRIFLSFDSRRISKGVKSVE